MTDIPPFRVHRMRNLPSEPSQSKEERSRATNSRLGGIQPPSLISSAKRTIDRIAGLKAKGYVFRSHKASHAHTHGAASFTPLLSGPCVGLSKHDCRTQTPSRHQRQDGPALTLPMLPFKLPLNILGSSGRARRLPGTPGFPRTGFAYSTTRRRT